MIDLVASAILAVPFPYPITRGRVSIVHPFPLRCALYFFQLFPYPYRCSWVLPVPFFQLARVLFSVVACVLFSAMACDALSVVVRDPFWSVMAMVVLSVCRPPFFPVVHARVPV